MTEFNSSRQHAEQDGVVELSHEILVDVFGEDYDVDLLHTKVDISFTVDEFGKADMACFYLGQKCHGLPGKHLGLVDELIEKIILDSIDDKSERDYENESDSAFLERHL